MFVSHATGSIEVMVTELIGGQLDVGLLSGQVDKRIEYWIGLSLALMLRLTWSWFMLRLGLGLCLGLVLAYAWLRLGLGLCLA